jgi:hypothetical protein
MQNLDDMDKVMRDEARIARHLQRVEQLLLDHLFKKESASEILNYGLNYAAIAAAAGGLRLPRRFREEEKVVSKEEAKKKARRKMQQKSRRANRR